MISAYLYGSSPKDGLPTHDRSKPVQFDVVDVVAWHLSRSYGDSRRYLGAHLKDGRMVFIVRSQLSREDASRLDKIAKRVRRGTFYAGSRSTMEFQSEVAK